MAVRGNRQEEVGKDCVSYEEDELFDKLQAARRCLQVCTKCGKDIMERRDACPREFTLRFALRHLCYFTGNLIKVYTLAMERSTLWSFLLNCVDSLDRTQKRTGATIGKVLPIRLNLNDNNLRDRMSPSPASIVCFQCIGINIKTKHGRGV
jgi:hypothetical protein